MQGDALPDSQSPQVLLAETRRVLDAQQRLVQRQRVQATNVVRIILTACGLVLTLTSLASSLELPGGDSQVNQLPLGAPGLGHTVILVVIATLTLLTCRMLCAALVVLEPRTSQQPLVTLLTTPIRASRRPSSVSDVGITFRSGLDADATTDLSATTNPTRDVVSYNAGCVAGNALLVEQNRWYLTRVYRSAIVGITLVTTTLLGAILATVLAAPT